MFKDMDLKFLLIDLYVTLHSKMPSFYENPKNNFNKYKK